MHWGGKDDSVAPRQVFIDFRHTRVLLHTARLGLHTGVAAKAAFVVHALDVSLTHFITGGPCAFGKRLDLLEYRIVLQ